MPLIESKQNPYTNTIVVLVFTLLIAGAAVFFLVLPQLKTKNANQDILDQKRVKTTELESLASKAKQSFASLEKNREVVERIDLAIPGKPNRTEMYAHVESLARSANMSLSMIDIPDVQLNSDAGAPQASAAGDAQSLTIPGLPNLKIMPINILVTGDYSSLAQFLSALEESLVLMDVQRIDVSTDDSSSALRYVLSINSYYQSK